MQTSSGGNLASGLITRQKKGNTGAWWITGVWDPLQGARGCRWRNTAFPRLEPYVEQGRVG